MNDSRTDFDLQGHRGARGLMPENTIPGFLKAMDLGVNTIEMDLVVTSDEELLVSHEPWFSHLFTTHPTGEPVTEEEERTLNIYQMTYEETQQYDVGMRINPNFPHQQPMEVTKPLFRDAVQAVEQYAQENNLQKPFYNIETKSDPRYYGERVPMPETFARLLNQELERLDEEFDIMDRVIIQSFDPQTLIEFRKLNDTADLAMLVSNSQTIESAIDTLGFVPDIWSPNYSLVTPELVAEAAERDMRVIPWTINTVDEMRRQLEMGVDGIITDYPDSAAVLRQ
ncbi:MAG: glycerophosphodiester phosphodiesterase family protein [Balneolaceae bacterium]|nr:glycerophosphodiester phosphodiesterase family protein [Balneolaceae bacterium]